MMLWVIKMFDCHYDLLTYIYMNRKNLNQVIPHCKKIFNNNITGGIFNLFYMSKQEMKEELNIEPNEIDIIQNLKEVNSLIKENKIIPNNIKYIIGIEGLDYLENIDHIDEMHLLGVRSTGIVWNNDNKFGSGVRGTKTRGLTKLGEELIEKLVDKKIAIDLSHANEKTFCDIINKCKQLKLQGKKPIVFASHSNAKMCANVPRNLNDGQLLEIQKLDGVIGVVSVKEFCTTAKNANYEMEYIKHINYLKELFGGVDNIAVATDDMSYYKIEPEYYQNMNVFKQENVKSKIEKLLIENNYTKEEIDKILTRNVEEKILEQL